MKLWCMLMVLSMAIVQTVSVGEQMNSPRKNKSTIEIEGQPSQQPDEQQSTERQPEHRVGQGSMQYYPLQKERPTLRHDKIKFQAELAYATMLLGFVEYSNKHQPGMVIMVEDYLKLKEGNIVQPTSFPAHQSDGPHTENQKRCIQHLNEPVLAANHICYDDSAPPSSIQFVTKEVHFEYYNEEESLQLVLECPIRVRRTERASIYFSISGRNPNWGPQQPDHYFVMVGSPSASDRVTILMLTRHHSIQAGGRLLCYADPTIPKKFIRLTLPKSSFEDSYRLLGAEAERAFITSDYYSFVSYEPRTWLWIDQLIKYVNLLKKGHEVDSVKDEKSKFEKASSEVKRSFCRKHVSESPRLRQKEIQLDENTRQDSIEFVDKMIKFSHLRIPSQSCSAVRCPVLFTRSQNQEGYVYFRPVHYRGKSRLKEYSFVLTAMPTEGHVVHIETLEEAGLHRSLPGNDDEADSSANSDSSSEPRPLHGF